MEHTVEETKRAVKKSVQVLFSNNTGHNLTRTSLFLNEGDWVTKPAESVAGPGTITFSCGIRQDFLITSVHWLCIPQ